MNINKKGEGGGIGILGVIFALFVFFTIRGCVQNSFQESINEFCIEEGYEYGEETVRNTVIECKNYDNTNSEKFEYELWKEFKDREEE